jgi:glutamate synthase domain-containing protein 3
VIEGQGFRFEPDALRAFADAGATLAGTVGEARAGLQNAGELPAGILGEVGESSGFVAAYGERMRVLGGTVDGIGAGMDGVAAAVRGYVEAALRHDSDAAAHLRRAGEPV